MKSYEVIREACDPAGTKAIARALHVSAALVYKWSERPPSDDDPDASGAVNPLDRLVTLYRVTQDARLIRYLCNAAGGFFVNNPEPPPSLAVAACVAGEACGMVRSFSLLLEAVADSDERTPGIQPEEADAIRQRWEELKACVERFVFACERGHYATQPMPPLAA